MGVYYLMWEALIQKRVAVDKKTIITDRVLRRELSGCPAAPPTVPEDSALSISASQHLSISHLFSRRGPVY